jgi:hypothetical protein
MDKLAFTDDFKLFDGECVRFRGYDGERQVMCGVTAYALKHHNPALPGEGLLPAEAFLATYERLMPQIHTIARRKYAEGKTEGEGEVEVMVHANDWLA